MPILPGWADHSNHGPTNHLKRQKKTKTAPRRATVSTRGFSFADLDATKGLLLFLQATVIAIAVLWIFWPALRGGWIGDDSLYFTNNPLMDDPARLWKAWFLPGSFIEYYPIEESVQWVQWNLWREETLGYHLTNVVLHIISSLLIWRFLSKLGLRLAWLGGLIFAVHPMTVDSVALINELKASLSLPPFLLAMCAWIDYAERGQKRDYLLALFFFLIAMLCKITMAMFPVVLLLYAWWKTGRIRWKDVSATIPFFVIALLLGLVTIWAGEVFARTVTPQAATDPHYGFLQRLVLAGEIIAFYLSRCFLPLTPMPVYPKWNPDPYSVTAYLPLLMLAGLIGFLWSKRATWGRHASLGLGFFLIMLAPFAGFHWISYMGESWILEHLVYIPIIGLIGLTVATLGAIDRRLSPTLRPAGIGVITLVMGSLAWTSHAYAKAFTDDATWASYIIRLNPNSFLAHNRYGNDLLQAGRPDEAVDQYTIALRIIGASPENPAASASAIAYEHAGLSVALAKAGRLTEAKEQIEIARQLCPQDPNFNADLGNILMMLRQIGPAIEQYKVVVQHQPDRAHAHLILASALMQAGRIVEAIPEFQMAAKLDPGSANPHYNLGMAFQKLNLLPQAVTEYRLALSISPESAEVHNQLGVALYLSGETSEARQQFEDALQINPSFGDAQNNLSQLERATPHVAK